MGSNTTLAIDKKPHTYTSADGVIVGNVVDKYHTRHPLQRWVVRRFLATLGRLYAAAQPEAVLEVGCGEGYLAQHLIEHWRPARFEACDVALSQVAGGIDPLIRFRVASVYALPYAEAEFDVVVCCEVLEHLEDPEGAVAELARVAGRGALISTPREPLWRALNFARGQYVRRLGNTPGHVQHFGPQALAGLLSEHFRVVQMTTSLPWLVAWCAH